MSRNLITKIENLEALAKLEVLDLSNNNISTLSGLPPLLSLKVLNVAKNKLQRKEDLQSITSCVCLLSVDLAENMISSVSALEPIFSLPLRQLRIEGNPLQESIDHCKNHILSHHGLHIANLDGLQYKQGGQGTE